MRAVIQFHSDSLLLNEQSIKAILERDGWNVVSLKHEEFWEKPENAFLTIQKNEFIRAVSPMDSKDLDFLFYIYMGHSSNEMHPDHEHLREGIVSINKVNKVYGIRIFKKKLSVLRSTCDNLVNLISDKAGSKKTTLTFNAIRLFASDGEADLIERGIVHISAGSKLRAAIRQKAIEFYGGMIFMVLAVVITLMSVHNRDSQNDFIINTYPSRFWVNYFERLMPPFIVSGGLLVYQFVNYQRSIFKRSSIIVWTQK